MMNSPQYRVFVCTKQRSANDLESCCCNAGALELYQAFQAEIQKRQLSDRVEVRRSGCLDRCEAGVVALIYQPEQQLFSWLPTKLQIKLRRWLFPSHSTYGHLNLTDVPDIMQSHFINGRPLKRCQI
jgi:(2Fe-2S) ferredoxin